MKICINCAYFASCKLASEEIHDCKKFKKISYDTKLVKVDGDIKIIERIEE